jgi:hypothetical protein
MTFSYVAGSQSMAKFESHDLSFVIQGLTKRETSEAFRRMAAQMSAMASPLIKLDAALNAALSIPEYPFGTVLRYPPTGDLAMVIGRSAADQWTETICLGEGKNSSGYEPGDIMRIRNFGIQKWTPET